MTQSFSHGKFFTCGEINKRKINFFNILWSALQIHKRVQIKQHVKPLKFSLKTFHILVILLSKEENFLVSLLRIPFTSFLKRYSNNSLLHKKVLYILESRVWMFRVKHENLFLWLQKWGEIKFLSTSYFCGNNVHWDRLSWRAGINCKFSRMMCRFLTKFSIPAT